MHKKVAVIILAAGKGERMKSETPKVLHPICGRPMLAYVLDLVKGLKAEQVVAVLGYKHQQVRAILPGHIKVVLQEQIRGTADAVKKAMPLLSGFTGTVLVLYGDNPLLQKQTLKKLLQHHIRNSCDATLLTATVEKPSGYGRILRDKYASICGIVEEKDADDFQKEIKEINTGIACFDKKGLSAALGLVKANNRKKEYYLTDAIGILHKKSCRVDAVKLADINEALGINSRVELAGANRIMQQRINEEFMKSGVSIVDPGSAFIAYGTKIGRDTTIYPFTVIERDVTIGSRCFIGPFAHLRDGTFLGDDVIAGNFLEIVRSRLSAKTLVKHFSYIGDARLGRAVNIGAGTVTANFDGRDKHITLVKDNAFIGSDTVLVSPVVVGRSAKTGAGSVVLKHTRIPDGMTAVGVPAKFLKRAR
ncbi:MAG TPA: NTP transferase domain-containing protein [Patescibacteria group bacterium]|nr:NTP transferase domain-containing protein [Patescibacteria group bacterium]